MKFLEVLQKLNEVCQIVKEVGQTQLIIKNGTYYIRSQHGVQSLKTKDLEKATDKFDALAKSKLYQ